jgi:uncharacterized membrane protein
MELAHMYESTKSADRAYFEHMSSNSSFMFGTMMIFWWITWALIIVALVLFIIWLWKQIQKGK